MSKLASQPRETERPGLAAQARPRLARAAGFALTAIATVALGLRLLSHRPYAVRVA